MNSEQKNDKDKIIRRPLVFDVDDILLHSGETIVEILNEKYELSPKLKFEDIKDWEFTYLKREIKRQKGIDLYTRDFLELFESEEFWKRVPMNKFVLDIILHPKINKMFMIRFVSTGTEKNLKLKEEYLNKHIDMSNFRFIGIPTNNKASFTKKDIDNHIGLWGGIQVDDNYNCLNSHASLKILIKNNKDTTYNQVKDIREDLYVLDNLGQLEDLLVFIADNPKEFFEDFYPIPFML